MTEIGVIFDDYIIPHAADHPMIVQAYLTCWITRFPHATVTHGREPRVDTSQGYERAISVEVFRIRVKEKVPADLRWA